MNLSLHKIGFIAVIIATTIIILSVLWFALWSFAATQYNHVIDGWIDAGRAQGYEITYGDRKQFGFPRHIVLRFSNVQWKNTDNIIFHADDIDIAALPWRWQVFDAKFKHHVEIDAPLDDSHALILGGDEGRAHVELDTDGIWKLSRISLLDAELGQTPHYVLHASSLKAYAERPEVPPADHKQPGLTLTGEAKNIILPDNMPSPFGPTMDQLDVAMRVMGTVPDFRKKESVDIWNKASGVVEFDKLHMDWGPMKITARGTMGFDDDLQPEGAFSGALDNHAGVLQALTEHNFIAKRQQSMLDSALSVFAKPSSISDAPGIEIPITVQLGGLFLGPVRIFTFSQIVWPQAAQTNQLPPPITVPTTDATPEPQPASEVPATPAVTPQQAPTP